MIQSGRPPNRGGEFSCSSAASQQSQSGCRCCLANLFDAKRLEASEGTNIGEKPNRTHTSGVNHLPICQPNPATVWTRQSGVRPRKSERSLLIQLEAPESHSHPSVVRLGLNDASKCRIRHVV
jgi:hypothetical protein